MTKREIILKYLANGPSSIQIRELEADISADYIQSVVYRFKNPEKEKSWRRRYDKSQKKKLNDKRYVASHREKVNAKNRRWNKNNPGKRSFFRSRNLFNHQRDTRESAHNHYQLWTTKELEYLTEYMLILTPHDIALKIGRTYAAVKRRIQKLRKLELSIVN